MNSTKQSYLRVQLINVIIGNLMKFDFVKGCTASKYLSISFYKGMWTFHLEAAHPLTREIVTDNVSKLYCWIGCSCLVLFVGQF